MSKSLEAPALYNFDRLKTLKLTPPLAESGKSAERSIWLAVNEVLSQNPRYPSNHKVTNYVQERLDFLSDRASIQVVVLADPIFNAMAVPGYVFIYDGLLKNMENQEELDAVLAHELTHLTRMHHFDKHTSHYDARNSIVANVGNQRGHEIEADIIGAELLDKKGINPLGMVTLLKKMNTSHILDKKDLPWYRKVDLIHGASVDRQLNLEELARVIDVRNLSNKTTTFGLLEDDFFADHLQAIDQQPQETLLEQMHLIHIKLEEWQEKYSNDQNNQEAINSYQQLFNQQIEIIEQSNLQFNKEQSKLAASLIFKEHSRGLINNTVDVNLPINDLINVIKNPIFINLGVDLLEAEVISHVRVWLGKNISENANDALSEIIRVCDLLPEQYQKIGFIIDVTEILLDRGLVERKNLPIIIDLFKDKQFDIDEWYLQYIGTDEIKNMAFNTYGRFDRHNEDTNIGKNRGYKATNFLLKEIHSEIETIRANKLMTASTFEDFLEIGLSLADILTIEDPIKMIRENKVIDTFIKGIQSVDLNVFIKTASQYLDKITNPGRKDSLQRILRNILLEASGDFFAWDKESNYKYDTQPKWMRLSLEQFCDVFGVLSDKPLLLDLINEFYFRSDKITELNKPELIDQSVSSIMATYDRLRSMGVSTKESIDRNDFKQLPQLMHWAKLIYFDEDVSEKSLVKLLKTLPVVGSHIHQFELKSGYIDEEKIDIIEELIDKEKYIVEWNKITKKVFDGYLANPNREMTEQLMAVIAMSPESSILTNVLPEIVNRMMKFGDFNQNFKLIFKTYGHLPRLIFTKALDSLIELQAKSFRDLAMVDLEVENDIGSFVNNDALIGNLSLFDVLLDAGRAFEGLNVSVGSQEKEYLGLEPSKLLTAMLSTADSDIQLRAILFNRWWNYNRHYLASANRFFKIEDIKIWRYPHKAAHAAHWVKELPPAGSGYKTFKDIVADFYGMNQGMRYGLMRKVLVGDKGVLSSDSSKTELMNQFISSRLESSSSGAEMVKQFISSLMEVGAGDELSLLLGPVMLDLILQPPKNPYPYRSLAVYTANKILKDLAKPTEYDSKLLVDKISNLMLGGTNVAVDTNSDLVTRLISEFSVTPQSSFEAKMTPWQLALTVGEKAGAVGTRMLQLTGQYFDVPAEVEDRLLSSYDSVRGQSKLQAYRVIVREAQLSHKIQEIINSVATFDTRIGGGSLMTVYKLEMYDGSQKVLGVRNPNVSYNVGKLMDLVKRVINSSSQSNPEDQDLALIEVLAGDVEKWINDELDDPDFELKDQQFRQQNDSRYGSFNGASQYQLLVPDIIPTGSRWVRCEDYVAGMNLTQLKISEELVTDIDSGVISKKDYQEVTKLLVKNYIYQISTTGLVHSDIHPGNFRITSDNKSVAVFDRYNLIKLDETDQQLIQQLIGSFMMGGIERARNAFIEYLYKLPENNEVTQVSSEEVKQKLNALDNEVALEDMLVDSIILLKRHGIKVPLKIALIGKNLQVLNSMSKQAGFGNLLEAYMF